MQRTSVAVAFGEMPAAASGGALRTEAPPALNASSEEIASAMFERRMIEGEIHTGAVHVINAHRGGAVPLTGRLAPGAGFSGVLDLDYMSPESVLEERRQHLHHGRIDLGEEFFEGRAPALPELTAEQNTLGGLVRPRACATGRRGGTSGRAQFCSINVAASSMKL